MEKIAGYEDYLDQIQNDASNMMEVSIFQDKRGFALRNIEKTAADFAHLYDIVPRKDISKGVVMATGQEGTDFIMLFFLATLCVFLVFGEKQAGLFMLTAPTEKGRQKMIVSKIEVLTVMILFSMTVFYGGNFILAGNQYGFGDLSRPLQSVGDYQASILRISIGEYFGLFIALKLLVYLVFGLVFFLICIFSKNMIQTIFLFSAVVGSGAVFTTLVAENSAFMALRYLNLFYFLKTDYLLTMYKNVNILGHPFHLLPVSIWLMILIMVVMISLILCSVQGCVFLQTIERQKDSRRIKQNYKARSVLGYEYIKLIKKSGVIWVLVLFAVIQVYRIWDYDYFRHSEEIYYKSYMDYLSGPVTDETKVYVEEENNRYEELWQKFAETDDLGRQSELRQQLLPLSAWERVVREYERVLDTKGREGIELSIVYPKGYLKLMGQDEKRDMVCAIMFGFLLCISLMSAFAGDTGVGMDRLIRTSFRGRMDTLQAKRKVSFLTAVLVFLLVYGSDLILIWQKIGLKEWGAPIQSLELFSDCTTSVTLWQYMILLFLIKFVGMWTYVCGIRMLSFFSRDTFRSLMISSIVFVLPGLLGLLRLQMVKYISLIPLLNANQILNGVLQGRNLMYAGCFGIVAVGIIISSHVVLSGKFRESTK